MPKRIAQVAPEIDTRENQIDVLPLIDTEGHAIRGRAVDAISIDPLHRRALVAERAGGGDRVSSGRHLDVGRDDADLTELRSNLRQRGYTGAVYAIVVGHQD